LSVKFVDDNSGWAIGRNGTILRTDDAGLNWVEQESGTKQNLYGLYLVKKIGWAVAAMACCFATSSRTDIPVCPAA